MRRVRISVDGSKYIIHYRPPTGLLKHRMFIGLVDDPDNVVSFNIGPEYYLSPTFDTIILEESFTNYTIYHIEDMKVSSKLINFSKPTLIITGTIPQFYFSYDGKILAEVMTSGDFDSVHILNAKGDSLIKGEMPQFEDIIGINNKYLITYHTKIYELHLWSIEELLETTDPSLIIDLIPGGKIYSIENYSVLDVRVIMGQNNAFLLTRKINMRKPDGNRKKTFELTKYKFRPYSTMDEFYESLLE